MPQKKICRVCPVCYGMFGVTDSDFSRAAKNSGHWKCGTCTRRVRNKAASLPFGAKRITGKGYVFFKTCKGWIQEHRLIMEVYLGRFLDPNEAVHHLNGNRQDNRLENLELMDAVQHTRMHHIGIRRGIKTREKISAKARLRHNPQKLTKEDVLAIRSEYAKGGVTYNSLARKYGVTPRAIVVVVKRINWKHI